jgi:3-oxoacyl-[acyl-carrier-protein] synthase II
MMKGEERVVVTGIGVVSPLGLNTSATWEKLAEGESGADYISSFDPQGLDTQFAAEVKGFDPVQYFGRKKARQMDRFAQLALASAQEAVERSHLNIDNADRGEIGVMVGSGMGGLSTLCEQHTILTQKGAGRVSPFLIPMSIVDIASAEIAIHFGIRGANFGVVSACASGAHAIGTAFREIKKGDVKVMIAGGSEAVIIPLAMAGFNAMRALSTRNDNPKKASRPFDAERDGFVMGEGAAMLVLESLDFALKREAPILGEIIGYGATADAHHIVEIEESGESIARAMRLATNMAGIKPGDIDYINAHGTGTKLNDTAETKAIKSFLGDDTRRACISSTKSMLGHMIGAAGAIEAIICLLAIRESMIPPTINYEHPDPECDLDYTPNIARSKEVKIALSNSAGFGGHNAVLILSSYEG